MIIWWAAFGIKCVRGNTNLVFACDPERKFRVHWFGSGESGEKSNYEGTPREWEN